MFKRRRRRRDTLVVDVRRVNSLICVALVVLLEVVVILYFAMYPFIQIFISKTITYYVVLGVHLFILLCALCTGLIMYRDMMPSIHSVFYINIFLIILITVNSTFTMVAFLYTVDETLGKEGKRLVQESSIVKTLRKNYPCIKSTERYDGGRHKAKSTIVADTRLNDVCLNEHRIHARDVTVYLNTVSLLEIVLLGTLILIIYFFYYNIPVW